MLKTTPNTNVIKGISWFILNLVIGVLNDIIMKYLGINNISPYQVVFLRFFFAACTLLPWLLTHRASFITKRPGLHCIRGAFLFIGIALWCTGLTTSKLAVAVTINFTIPIFTMLLAVWFLKERCSKTQIIAAIIGLLGIFVVLNPTSLDFNVSSLVLICSAFLFASLDVINKTYVSKESTISMLFYSNLFTALFALIPALATWTTLAALGKVILLFLALGAGGNLILYCLLKSFSYVDVSFVAPYRYLELLFSIILGKLFFSEEMDVVNYLGIILIMLSTFLLSYKAVFKKK